MTAMVSKVQAYLIVLGLLLVMAHAHAYGDFGYGNHQFKKITKIIKCTKSQIRNKCREATGKNEDGRFYCKNCNPRSPWFVCVLYYFIYDSFIAARTHTQTHTHAHTH